MNGLKMEIARTNCSVKASSDTPSLFPHASCSWIQAVMNCFPWFTSFRRNK